MTMLWRKTEDTRLSRQLGQEMGDTVVSKAARKWFDETGVFEF